jgi:hypothetical protein
VQDLAGPAAGAVHGDAFDTCFPGLPEDGSYLVGPSVGGQVDRLGDGSVDVPLRGGVQADMPGGHVLMGGDEGTT